MQVKVGIRNLIIVGVLAVIFILSMKVIFTKFHVPVISPLFQAV